MKKIDSMLFRMIKQSKGQFVAVLVIIMVGIAIFTALLMASVNLKTTKDSYYAENCFADLYAEAGHIPASAVGRLESIPGIAAAEGRLTAEVPFVSDGKERINVKLLSVKGEDQQINRLVFAKGRQIRDPNREALLYKPFAEARNIGVGDRIQLQINGLRYTLSVCGIVESPEFIYLMENAQSMMPNPKKYGVVYVSEALAQQALSMSGAYNEVEFLYDKDGGGNISGGISGDDLADTVKNRLTPYGRTQVIKGVDQLSNSMVNQEINQLEKVCVALPALFLMVAALVLMMMLGRMVKKDRMKIGILKAMGYSNGQVFLHYVKYSLTAGFFGGLLGIGLGTMVSGYMTNLYIEFFSMPSYGVKIYFGFYGLAVLLSCLFCVLSGLWGAREALYITPAEAMQPETPRVGRRIFLERFSRLWGALSFSRKMVVRNVFRSKRRSLFVLAGVALTFGMLICILTMPQVIDNVMVKYFSQVQRMDYSVSFYSPVTKKAVGDMERELPGADIEGKIEYPFQLTRGNRNKTVTVIGIAGDTEFLGLTDLKDRPVHPEPGGILLTENLAKALKAKAGDQIKLESYLPGGKTATITVTGIVKQMLGINGYMEIDTMAEKLLEKNAINGVYINSDDPNVVPILQKEDMVSSITSTEEMKNTYENFLGLMVLSIGCMVFLAGILGFCIVYNATIVSLGEREMEFSSLRVLGFSRAEIFRMILSENGLLSAAGLILGFPLGCLMAGYSTLAFSTDMYVLYMEPTLGSVAAALAATIAFILLSQVAAHQKIYKLDFLQALKNRAS